MSNDVTFQREEYEAALYAWNLVDDACAGQERVKSKQDIYLPRPNPSDKSTENKERYNQYLLRAVFYNATGRTKDGMVGAAYRKDPIIKTPTDYVMNDVDGNGVGIVQQSQSSLSAVLKRGRHGLLTDYPQVDGPVSKADMNAGKYRANIVPINAKQIINWRTEKIGGQHKLVLLVFSEAASETTEDGFGEKKIDQYRALKLGSEGYTQEIWRKGEKDWELYSTHIIKDGAGNNWDEIPFTFIGSNNNDTIIDPSPLYDMAEVNIAHYRNSADYEDSIYFCGQPQPWMAGLSEEWRNHLEEKGIYIGGRAPVLLPVGGAFGFAQAQPNTLAKEGLDQKEDQMVALGARLIQPGTVAKTATESQGEQATQHSVLSLACSNVSDAYEKALSWVARFMNIAGDIEFQISREFVEQKLDPQMLSALVSAWHSGNLPETDLWEQYRQHNVIDPEKTDEAIREELDSQDQGLNLDGE
jgi:hypothetical protein